MSSTVAAISTPNAAGGIGIVKISGPDAISVAERVFSPAGSRTLSELPGFHAAFGSVVSGDSVLDQCIAIVYRAPKSYTGEDVVELQCHGGLTLMQLVLRLVLAAGAEPAGPGEFTKRAFLNGKLDLSEAESVMDLIGAHGEQAVSAAVHALEGSLSREIRGCADTLVAESAHIAAWVDYPDEDVEPLDRAELAGTLKNVAAKLEALTEKFDAGQAVTAGVETVIAGRPNVGKSTLMNLLLGRNRSIVTAVAGTTRDVIEETARIGNVVLRLSDTAGLHDSDDPVESIGIEMAHRKLDRAALILAVFDGNEPLNDEDRQILEACKGRHSIAIINKTDLGTVVPEDAVAGSVSRVLSLSAKDPSCYDQLVVVLEDLLGTADFDPSAAMLANERQLACVNRSLSCIRDAVSALESDLTLDTVGLSTEAAIEPLLELTGERVSDTVIEQVFERFCVGK